MVLYVLLGALCVAAVWLWGRLRAQKEFWEKFNKFKGDKTWPIIGHAYQFLTDDLGMIATIERMHRDYGMSTFRLQLGRCCVVFLSDPDTCEVLLRSNNEIHKSGDYGFLFDWLGEGLFLSNGRKGKFIRKAITPMLHFKTLENFIDVYEAKGSILMEKLAAHRGEVFNVHHLMTLCSLDVICEAVMGVEIKAQEDPNSDYVRAIYSECELFKERLLSSWKRVQLLYYFTGDYWTHRNNIRELHSLTDLIIRRGEEKYRQQSGDKETHQDNHRASQTFLDMLLTIRHPDGSPLSGPSMRAEVNSLLFGGHETVSIALSCTSYLLANHPDVQRRAYEEQLAVLGPNTLVAPRYEDLEKMRYLERVIKESLRLYPPAPIYSRLLQGDLHLPDGLVIPAGCQVVVAPYFLARNPKYYPDPYTFDPDRFLPENTRHKHPYSMLSFSAGPRNCVGQRFAMMEIKCILSKLLRRYHLLPGGPGTELQITVEVLLKSKNGVQISLEDRQ